VAPSKIGGHVRPKIRGAQADWLRARMIVFRRPVRGVTGFASTRPDGIIFKCGRRNGTEYSEGRWGEGTCINDFHSAPPDNADQLERPGIALLRRGGETHRPQSAADFVGAPA
jgi:hypothetical protein